MASPIAKWVLPVPGGPSEDHVLLAGNEVQGAEVGDQVAFQPTGMVEVELLQTFASRESGGLHAAFAAVGVAGGDLALQAGGQVLLVAPGLGPGPLGQPASRLSQRRRFQRPGQKDQLGG